MIDPQRRRDLSLALLLATVSLSTSVLLDVGLVCSNDGAHFALVRALAEDHSPVIDRFLSYTRHVDLSERDGHFYSDRPPGTALLALPFYGVAKAMGASPEHQEAITVLLAAVLGAVAVALTFLVGRRLGLSRAPAALGALTLALCTPHRTYSSALWSHAPLRLLRHLRCVPGAAHHRNAVPAIRVPGCCFFSGSPRALPPASTIRRSSRVA